MVTRLTDLDRVVVTGSWCFATSVLKDRQVFDNLAVIQVPSTRGAMIQSFDGSYGAEVLRLIRIVLIAK